MEGTENLDDEAYTKRHLKLEIDERRRKRFVLHYYDRIAFFMKASTFFYESLTVFFKTFFVRWDVQRIREQRIIEKLKQRHEKSSLANQSEPTEQMQSFWPCLEDIKYIEISDQLPVSAFGCPVPKIQPR